jgi:hypothetical protein
MADEHHDDFDQGQVFKVAITMLVVVLVLGFGGLLLQIV